MLDSLVVPNFVISVPGILPGNNYRADFYADLNGNGTYDPPPIDHAWRVLFSDSTGNVAQNFSHNTIFTNINWPTSITLEPQVGIPDNFALSQNYPNPFNPSTTIAFNLPKASRVTLKVFNVLGEEVATLVSDRLSSGSYSYAWNASGLASGIYLYILKAEGFLQTRKMILTK